MTKIVFGECRRIQVMVSGVHIGRRRAPRKLATSEIGFVSRIPDDGAHVDGSLIGYSKNLPVVSGGGDQYLHLYRIYNYKFVPTALRIIRVTDYVSGFESGRSFN